jgi:hypothetical protein
MSDVRYAQPPCQMDAFLKVESLPLGNLRRLPFSPAWESTSTFTLGVHFEAAHMLVLASSTCASVRIWRSYGKRRGPDDGHPAAEPFDEFRDLFTLAGSRGLRLSINPAAMETAAIDTPQVIIVRRPDAVTDDQFSGSSQQAGQAFVWSQNLGPVLHVSRSRQRHSEPFVLQ